MPVLEEKDLNSILTTLKGLQEIAKKSKQKFQENISIIPEIINYIEENKTNLINNYDINQNIKFHLEVIKQLAKLKTNDPKKKEIIEKLIDNFTPDEAYISVYAGLQKLAFSVADSKFISKESVENIIKETTAYIASTFILNPGAALDQARIKLKLAELKQMTKDPKKIDLITSLEKKLYSFMTHHEIKDINQVNANIKETESDWKRMLEGNTEILINGELLRITNSDITEKFQEFKEVIKNLLPNPQHIITFRPEHHEKENLPVENLIDKLLSQIKGVDMVATNEFIKIYQEVVSEVGKCRYLFTTNPDNTLQVDFKCDAKSNHPQSPVSKFGTLTVKLIYKPDNHTFEFYRRFDQNPEHLTVKPKKH